MFSNKDLRRLLIPLILEQLLSGLMGIADTLMVARVGDTALSAVSCVDAINNLIFYLFSAMAAGGTIICAQYLGRKDRKNAVRAGQQVFVLTLALALLITGICIPLRRPLLGLIFGRVEDAIMTQSVQYFLLTALSYPFLALQQTSAAQFRAGGNARLPMLITALANVTNVAGNAVLIFGCGMGVRGAAIATLGSRILNAVVLMLCQRNPKTPIPFRDYATIRVQKSMILRILRIALPNGIENSMFQLGRLLVQSTVATLGTTAIAAQAMTCTLDSLPSLPGMALGVGTLTVVGRCMGAGEIDQARQYTRKLCKISWLSITIPTLLVLGISPLICSLGGLSPEATTTVIRLLIFISVGKLLFWVPSFTLPNTLRASGDVAYSALVSACSMWFFRVMMSAVLCRFLGFGLEGVWIPWIADWVCRTAFYVWRYRSGAWQKKSVLDTVRSK